MTMLPVSSRMKNLVCIARSQCKKFSLVCCMHFSATQHRAQVTSSPSQLRFAFHHDRASVFASKEEEGREQWHASVKAFTPSFADAGSCTAARSTPLAGWHCGHLGDSVYIHLSCCWWCHSVQCMHGAWEAASTHSHQCHAAGHSHPPFHNAHVYIYHTERRHHLRWCTFSLLHDGGAVQNLPVQCITWSMGCSLTTGTAWVSAWHCDRHGGMVARPPPTGQPSPRLGSYTFSMQCAFSSPVHSDRSAECTDTVYCASGDPSHQPNYTAARLLTEVSAPGIQASNAQQDLYQPETVGQR